MSKDFRISGAISLYPARRLMVEDMLKKLDIGDRKFTIQVDTNLEGVWANAQKAWRSYDPDATHHLVMEDDLLLPRDLMAGIEEGLKYVPEGMVMSLFQMGGMIWTAGELGSSWAVSTGCSAQGLVVPVDIIEDWIEWSLRNCKEHVIGADWRLAMYASFHGIKFWHTCPTLVEHLGARETMVQKRDRSGYGSSTQLSSRFLGEEKSALHDMDYSKMAEKPPRWSSYGKSSFLKDMSKTKSSTKDAELQLQKIQIKDLKEYANNPRVNQPAVDSLKKSIKSYGYQQPIVVTTDNTILAGHTRLRALKELVAEGHTEYEEVDVIIAGHLNTDEANQFRIVDNKTGEIATWNSTLLASEIEQLKNVKDTYFSESELKDLAEKAKKDMKAELSREEIDNLQKRMSVYHDQLATKGYSYVVKNKRHKCKSCGGELKLGER